MAARDPEATKNRILAAALHEFSAKGISGARVDAIAARAKVNKRMLYYYFGSKDALFREILRRRLEERSELLLAAAPDTARSIDRMGDQQRRAAGNREYVRLLMWEALETSPTRPANEASRRDFYRAWIEDVQAAQAEGTIPADLDAAQLVLSEMLLVIGPIAFSQLTRLVTGQSADDPEFIENRIEFLERLEGHITEPATARH